MDPMVDLPLGFGMSLSRDFDAMRYFSSLSPDMQRDLIDQTHRIHSRDEMQSFVAGMTPQDLAP